MENIVKIIAKKKKKSKIRIGEKYKIKGNCPYFIEKYSTSDLIARVDKGPFYIKESSIKNEEEWRKEISNFLPLSICIYLDYNRVEDRKLPLHGNFYYSHIKDQGEIIHESEFIDVNRTY